MDTVKSGDRNQLENHKNNTKGNADECHCFKELCPVSIFLRCNECGCRREEIADRRADGCHIHEPAQGFTAEDGTGQGDRDAEDHGVSGSAVAGVNPAEIAAIPPTSIMREFIGGQTL